MEWTLAQCEHILVHYGNEGYAYCPEDQVLLGEIPPAGRDSRGVMFNLCCPRCGRELFSRQAAEHPRAVEAAAASGWVDPVWGLFKPDWCGCA